MFIDTLIIGSSAIGASFIWAYIIEPWIEKRSMNGSFVMPQSKKVVKSKETCKC